MSEPYIRVYAADMRADPAVSELDMGQRYLLIQLWDLAKNGPGDPEELLGPDGQPMSPKTIARLLGASYQWVNGGVNRMVYLGVCERSTTGSIRFPRLKQRQGLDTTNAARQARFRKKVTPKVTAEVTVDITAQSKKENQNQKDVEPSGSPSLRNEQWDALEEIMGYRPTGTEQREWGAHCRDLKAAGLGRAEILLLPSLYHADMPDVTMTVRALVKHGPRLIAQPQRRKTRRLSSSDLLERARQEREPSRNGGAPSHGPGRVPELERGQQHG